MRQRQSLSPLHSGQRVLEAAGHVQLAYIEPAELPRWLATSGRHPLALVSFGTPVSRPLPCPVIRLDLPQLDDSPRYELWSSDQPVRVYRKGGFSAAVSGDILLASISLPEAPGAGLDHTTHAAYRDLLQQLRALGFPFLWRIWNYFPGINDEQEGLERYRRFCIGRHQALAGSLTDFPDSLPAGTAVGTRSGHLQIYVLAGTRPVTHLGNPRQVDAYDYPISYGPCSPSFARATVYRSDSHAQLFIAGTASIVGHESQHRGLPDQQSRETVVNLHALIDHAEHFQPSVEGNRQRRSFLKVYVRNLKHLDSIRNALQDPLLLSSQVLFLQGDLCRRELLVEIEGLITRD